ncbi:secoisolariciresinol dehydrogenase-like [Primulina tabacum]|uniref:secoisolariciresinol dehydrogenase-like n=1 Tax=Primulina tabacum TaxID=48773 RepID=UPI003F59D799
MSMAKRLEGKVAIVTGGASGIGEATVRLFVQNGAKVIIADVQDELGQKVCQDIGPPEDISYVHCDVTDESDVQTTVDTAISKHGNLDIMFANAGIAGARNRQGIIGTDYEDLKRVFETNVFGAFLCAKHAARVMIPAKKGSIVFTSSVASVTYGDVPHPYVASKCAVVGLANNLCIELGQYGIRVNCVSPFGIASPMLINELDMGKSEVEELFSEIATLKGEVVDANDVAEAVLFLVNGSSKYVSGQNLVIDGGYSLTNVALREAYKKMLVS